MLKTSPLNFIGNIEGRDVYSGSADVVMCDGFIGNVALKISEGVAMSLKAMKLLMKELSGSWLGRLAYPLIAKPLLNLKRKIDYAGFGGAPLLGVNRDDDDLSRRSSAKAIKMPFAVAKGLAETRLDELIQRDIEESLRRHRMSGRKESRRETCANHRTGSACSRAGDDQRRPGTVGCDLR